MTIDKHCLAPGCTIEPHFGYGSLLNGVMRWACGGHRALLNPSAEKPAIGAVKSRPASVSSAESIRPKQAVLL